MPSLAHGQMEVYARHWNEIMRLAARNVSADESFRRIENYARIERAACFWGWMPRAIADEDSPFNECSHAYLSAGKVLLDEMRKQAPPGSDVSRLGEIIDWELMAAGVLVLCRFSGSSFNTADHIGPQWGEVVNHAPTLAVLVGSAFLILTIPAALWSLPLARAPRRRLGRESR